MEDVLDLYAEAYDPKRPVVCFDELPFQLLAEVNEPLPAEPGKPKRQDYEYERKGHCSLFIAFEPLTGQRHVTVREHRTSADFAHEMQHLVARYPDVDVIRVVLDNLSTHTPAALYQTFPADEARRLTQKLELHFTPKHGSWLNMAEIEWSVLARQALKGRLPDLAAVEARINPWRVDRNQRRATVNWCFSTGSTAAWQHESGQRLARTVADAVALALSNLRLREKLRHQSIRDPLTGLFNRRYLEETLERELSRATRGDHPIGLVVFDIDHFKRFNDTFGHEAGDVVLRELGVLLKGHLRDGDIACRYGGEEFVLMLLGVSLEATRLRAEALRGAVKRLGLSYRNQSLGLVSLSLGVASFPAHGHSADALFRAADEALYRAKREGRDQVVVA